MGRIAWNTTEPGHCEVDLVYHSGPTVSGEHAHTIQMVDVATGWSERVAVMGRGHKAMQVGFERIVQRVPFVILELHPDNGAEFFNQHLVRFWKERVVGGSTESQSSLSKKRQSHRGPEERYVSPSVLWRPAH